MFQQKKLGKVGEKQFIMGLSLKDREISPSWFEFNQGLAKPLHWFFEPLGEVSPSYMDTHDRFLNGKWLTYKL